MAPFNAIPNREICIRRSEGCWPDTQLKDARRRSHERLQYTTAGALGCIAIGGAPPTTPQRHRFHAGLNFSAGATIAAEECNVAIVEAGAVQAIIECFSTTDIVTVRQECGSALANITRTGAPPPAGAIAATQLA